MKAENRMDVAYSMEDRESAPTFHFMLKCLLYSRLQTGLVSNKEYYDEDVNVYMAHLLQAFINPAYLDRTRPYLSQYDSDVFSKLSKSMDARLKYTIYKTNADFLLVSMGIFDDGSAMQPERRKSRGERNDASAAHPAEEAYVGRGKTYYRFAYTFSQQLPRKNQAITEVLEKLAVGFDRYVKILTHMRGEYFDLMKRLSDGEVFHLQQVVNEEAKKAEIEGKQNDLLDLFLEWQKSRDDETWQRIQSIVEELKALSPGFRFNLPRA